MQRKAMAKEASKPQPKGKGKESVRVLISRTRLQKRITEMAREIRKDFPDEPLHLVGVLKGAVFFLTDLGKQIPGDVSFDFIAVSSYGVGTHSSGQVRLTRDLDSHIEGKTVIVVEDILDTGMTLQYLLRVFEQRRPKRIRVAVLLDKRRLRPGLCRALPQPPGCRHPHPWNARKERRKGRINQRFDGHHGIGQTLSLRLL
jgi:hypoxanthine phosphoribosyltransferase